MSANVRILVPAVLPPMHQDIRRTRRPARPAFLPQIARASYALAALALPSLGLALAHGFPRADTGRAASGIVAAIALAETAPIQRQQRTEATDSARRSLMSSIHAQ